MKKLNKRNKGLQGTITAYHNCSCTAQACACYCGGGVFTDAYLADNAANTKRYQDSQRVNAVNQ